MRYIMIFLILTACVFGSYYAGGSGTSSSPFQIANKTNLLHLMNDDDPNWASGVYFILTANIDMDSEASDDEIGTKTLPFNANFDGDGYTISNIALASDGYPDYYSGFFGCVGPNGTVHDLNLSTVSIGGMWDVGGFVGINQGTIYDCTIASVTITITVNYAINSGAFCGSNTGNIYDCHVDGTSSVTSASYRAGGFVGQNGYRSIEYYMNHIYSGRIYRCYTNATVSVSNKPESGGFFGQSTGVIVDCYSTGNVSCDGGMSGASLGGFGGHVSGGTISRCHSTGSVTAGGSCSTIGGFVGETEHGGTHINYCYAEGAVSATNAQSKVGGFCGNMANAIVDHCYATGNVSTTGVGTMVGGFSGQVYLFGGTKEGSMTVTDCWASGSVTGYGSVGGFIGHLDEDTSLDNCWSKGVVTTNAAGGGASSGGGFTGTDHNTGTTTTSCYWDKTLAHPLSSVTITAINGDGVHVTVDTSGAHLYWPGDTVNITSTNYNFSGIAISTITDADTFVLTNATTGASSTGTVAIATPFSASGTGKTTTEMKQAATYTDWTFGPSDWYMTEGSTYPAYYYPKYGF